MRPKQPRLPQRKLRLPAVEPPCSLCGDSAEVFDMYSDIGPELGELGMMYQMNGNNVIRRAGTLL